MRQPEPYRYTGDVRARRPVPDGALSDLAAGKGFFLPIANAASSSSISFRQDRFELARALIGVTRADEQADA